MLASQLRHHPAWTAAGLAAELAAARDRLELMRAENVSVAAAFDLSYRDLTGGQRRLFRRLGLHPGPDIDAYAAAALAGTGLAGAHRHLEGLYDQHLITEPARGRYRLHDLIREHARTLAAADDPAAREAATGRLLDYYLHTALAASQHIATRVAAAKAAAPPAGRRPARRQYPRPSRQPPGWRTSGPTCTRPPATPPPPAAPVRHADPGCDGRLPGNPGLLGSGPGPAPDRPGRGPRGGGPAGPGPVPSLLLADMQVMTGDYAAAAASDRGTGAVPRSRGPGWPGRCLFGLGYRARASRGLPGRRRLSAAGTGAVSRPRSPARRGRCPQRARRGAAG